MTLSRPRRIGRFLLVGAIAACVVCLVSACSLFATPAQSGEKTHGATASHTPPQPTPKPSNAPTAFVTIAQVNVDGRNLTVAGFVSGISEDGGTCTFAVTSTSTGAVVKVKSTGIRNSGTTSCGSQLVPISELSRGAWSVVLQYQSDSAQLKSGGLQVQVP
jgi:hypothetical protein